MRNGSRARGANRLRTSGGAFRDPNRAFGISSITSSHPTAPPHIAGWPVFAIAEIASVNPIVYAPGQTAIRNGLAEHCLHVDCPLPQNAVIRESFDGIAYRAARRLSSRGNRPATRRPSILVPNDTIDGKWQYAATQRHSRKWNRKC